MSRKDSSVWHNVCQRNRIYFQVLGLEGDFTAASGLLISFKQRNGIWKITIQGAVNDCLMIFRSPLQIKICSWRKFIMLMELEYFKVPSSWHLVLKQNRVHLTINHLMKEKLFYAVPMLLSQVQLCVMGKAKKPIFQRLRTKKLTSCLLKSKRSLERLFPF